MKDLLKAVCYGEILWDVFPDGKALGGAPLNVCLRLKSLGIPTQIISRLGSDPLAEETQNKLNTFDLDQQLIQKDNSLDTGQVSVRLDESGSASYQIKKPVAWDAIEYTQANQEAVRKADLFIFGSLAARSETSRETLNQLITASNYAVFDVNLRAPHYTMQHLLQFMKQAQLVKMNDEELAEITAHLGIKSTIIEEQLAALSKETDTHLICVTCGKDGAVLYKNGTLHAHSGYPTTVVDTVGAGDSFLAGLVYQLFKTESTPEEALAFACALGALVAGKKGANATITKEEIFLKMKA